MRYYAFHKPRGVLSQFTSKLDKKTLDKFGLPSGIYSVGRLDEESEGLLILTDDGGFKSYLQSNKVGKVYHVLVAGKPSASKLKQMAQGLYLDDKKTLPCQAQLFKKNKLAPFPELPQVREETSWLEVTLFEGRNRQVRRMTAAIGHPTLRLMRLQIGELSLGPLLPGQFKKIRAKDVVS